MNDQQFQGKWQQLKGSVRHAFAELTEDDVEQVKGRKEHLIGRIRERYGDAREAALEKVDAFLAGIDEKLD